MEHFPVGAFGRRREVRLIPARALNRQPAREMFEEIGLRIGNPGAAVGRRVSTFRWIDGEMVEADERFLLVRCGGQVKVSVEGWTNPEREVITGWRWWSRADLGASEEQIYPADLARILRDTGVW